MTTETMIEKLQTIRELESINARVKRANACSETECYVYCHVTCTEEEAEILAFELNAAIAPVIEARCKALHAEIAAHYKEQHHERRRLPDARADSDGPD
jgi:hypothetical protein